MADVARPTALSRDFGRFCREAAASGALDAGAWERGASDCTGAAPRPPVCGDGVVERGESCDDGNVRDGDACSARCRTGGLFGSHLSVFDEADAPSRRRVSLVLRDAAVELPAHGDGDPTQVGALLVLRNPGTGEEARVALPAKGWSALGIPAGSRGYRYRDPARDAGPCELADARAGRWIRAFCSGERLGFTLDEPAQSALTATFGVGDAHPMCAAFASPYVRRDVPAIGTAPGAFLGRAAPAPAFCEPP
ncbi:MAG: hypothetical protein DCC71_17635 [Proteobacteria bacterium]|nr:MAG: hypothetical protein DCC71_17635 [Pseudomonadota bacterium]